MDIKTSLERFYDAEAEKYYHTRNKHRPDADIVMDALLSSGKKTIKILEFGCGSGRLLAHLTTISGIRIEYTGVDLSQNLLRFAKKQLGTTKHIKATFVHDDIIHYIAECTQESFDIVVGIASFQHIPTSQERFFLIKNAYRILIYGGKLIMTNRSYSRRFLKKYHKACLYALRLSLISGGKRQWNDLMIPWNRKHQHLKRFYHLFTRKELEKIISLSGFILVMSAYLKKGKVVDTRKKSDNSLIIAEKIVFLQNE